MELVEVGVVERTEPDQDVVRAGPGGGEAPTIEEDPQPQDIVAVKLSIQVIQNEQPIPPLNKHAPPAGLIAAIALKVIHHNNPQVINIVLSHDKVVRGVAVPGSAAEWTAHAVGGPVGRGEGQE